MQEQNLTNLTKKFLDFSPYANLRRVFWLPNFHYGIHFGTRAMLSNRGPATEMGVHD